MASQATNCSCRALCIQQAHFCDDINDVMCNVVILTLHLEEFIHTNLWDIAVSLYTAHDSGGLLETGVAGETSPCHDHQPGGGREDKVPALRFSLIFFLHLGMVSEQ